MGERLKNWRIDKINMTRIDFQYYDDPRDVKFTYFAKQLLRFGGLATAATSTVIATGQVLTNNYTEDSLMNCLVWTGAGLIARFYSDTMRVFRTEDSGVASWKDVLGIKSVSKGREIRDLHMS